MIQEKKKTSTTFSIDQDLLSEFVKICEDNSYNRSKIVEKYIETFVNTNKIDKK